MLANGSSNANNSRSSGGKQDGEWLSAVLREEIERDLGDLQALVAQTATLMQKVETTGDTDYLGTVVLNLHGFYSGI